MNKNLLPLYSLFLLPFYAICVSSWKFQQKIAHLAKIPSPIIPTALCLLMFSALYYFRSDVKKILDRFKTKPGRYLAILLPLPAWNIFFLSSPYINIEFCTLSKNINFFHTLLWLSTPFFLLFGVFFLLMGFFPRKRLRLFWWFWSMILLNIFALIVISWQFYPMVKRSAVKSATIAGEEIIRAIEAYKSDQKEYPKKLNKLIPKYLPKIPHTRMCAYPKFQYAVVGEPFSEASSKRR